MSIPNAHLLASLCLLATLTSYGCENGNGENERTSGLGPTRPSQIAFSGVREPLSNSIDFFARGVTLEPASVTPRLVPSAVCPNRPPLLAPIRLVAVADPDWDLFLTRVHMRFVDRKGAFGGSLTFAGPDLVKLFGSTRIPRRRTRSFPFAFPFGCTGEAAGTLTVAVFTGDALGREKNTSLSVAVDGV